MGTHPCSESSKSKCRILFEGPIVVGCVVEMVEGVVDMIEVVVVVVGSIGVASRRMSFRSRIWLERWFHY